MISHADAAGRWMKRTLARKFRKTRTTRKMKIRLNMVENIKGFFSSLYKNHSMGFNYSVRYSLDEFVSYKLEFNLIEENSRTHLMFFDCSLVSRLAAGSTTIIVDGTLSIVPKKIGSTQMITIMLEGHGKVQLNS